MNSENANGKIKNSLFEDGLNEEQNYAALESDSFQLYNFMP